MPNQSTRTEEPDDLPPPPIKIRQSAVNAVELSISRSPNIPASPPGADKVVDEGVETDEFLSSPRGCGSIMVVDWRERERNGDFPMATFQRRKFACLLIRFEICIERGARSENREAFGHWRERDAGAGQHSWRV